MRYLVLTTRPEDNRYGDTPSTYSFPARYRSLFSPLDRGEEMMAVLYEPRRGQGRQSYVAWTTIQGAPEADPANPQLWMIRYAQEIRPFSRLVPKAVEGRDFEELLRLTPLVKHGPTLQGRSVREISPEDFLAILTYAEVIPEVMQTEIPDLFRSQERAVVERMVRRLARDGSFRERVLRAYDFRCAVTGIGYRQFQQFGAGRLVDGAHLKPVAAQGSDETTNGLALTPSLHGLFDAGLFTLEYRGDALVMRVADALRHCDLTPHESTSRLVLSDGQPVRLPTQVQQRPDLQALAYHRQIIFQG